MGGACPRLMLLCGVIALALASALVPGLKAANPQNSDIFVQVLGGTADLAAEKAYREADVYFHAGITEESCPEHHRARVSLSGDHGPADLPLLSLIRRLHGETAPKKIRHISSTEEKELLPWFVAAVRLNPRHVEAWRTGSYWFYRTGNLQHAEEFIRDGIRHNPGDYRLYLDRGILYYRMKQWEKAIEDLKHARRLWKKDSEDAPYDLHAIRAYLKDSRRRLNEAMRKT